MSARHKWDSNDWPDREATCLRCGMVKRRFGIGSDSYHDYQGPTDPAPFVSDRVPPCEPQEVQP